LQALFETAKVTFAMLVIAHRGASAAFTENTLAAFAGAAALGADGVELDVRRTADGRLAVTHDAIVPDGGLVVETAFADLPDHVTDLAHALDQCAPLRLVNIEIKNWPDDPDFDPSEQLAANVVALLDERGELDGLRNLISSFHLPTVDRVHELAPGLPTAWLLVRPEVPEEIIATAAEHGHAAVHPHHAFVDEGFVRHAHDAGLVVNAWTCDESERIRWLADVGVDGVVTNVPDVALAALNR
jgi:glycerophosphoryl diester phosphodiesterase